MIYTPCDPGSAEWHKARLGIPTSSCFDRIVTRKGAPSKAADRYLCTLIAERMLGANIETFESEAMARGKEIEDEALAYFEMQTDIDTSPGGFVTLNDGSAGCSPDRLIRNTRLESGTMDPVEYGTVEGGLEIKAPTETVQVGLLCGFEDVTWKHRLQVQGSMWVTGAAWWFILAYHPEFPPALVKVERDEKLIEAIAKHVAAFNLRLDDLHKNLQHRATA